MSNDKDSDDVSKLVSELHLDGLHYREFGTHKPASAMRVVAGLDHAGPAAVATATKPVAAPVVAPRAAAPAVPARTEPKPPPAAAAPSTAGSTPGSPVGETAPLSNTFERLRRQSLSAGGPSLRLQLDLAPRQPMSPAATPTPRLRERPLSAIFASLDSASRDGRGKPPRN